MQQKGLRRKKAFAKAKKDELEDASNEPFHTWKRLEPDESEEDPDEKGELPEVNEIGVHVEVPIKQRRNDRDSGAITPKARSVPIRCPGDLMQSDAEQLSCGLERLSTMPPLFK